MSIAQTNDIEQIRTEHERALDALLQISYAVGSVMELPDILRRIAKEAAEVVGADVCSIFLYDKDKTRLRLRASHGLNPCVVDQATLAPGQGIPGWVAQTGEILALSDATRDPRHRPMEGSGEEDLRACLCGPLRIQEELIGVMTARMAQVRHFDPSEITLFETICKQVAIVIEKARLYQEKVEAERLAAVAVGLSEIAHYIKNLLQAIEGGAFVVEKGLAGGDLSRVRDGWQLLRRSNKKIADLVASMLSYCRQEQPVLSMASLTDLLREVVESAQAGAERHEVQIVESYDPGIPDMLLDEEFLHDAVLNLVTNAIEAIPESGGVVVVRAKPLAEENRVLIEVADSGGGIPPEIQDKIFALFFSTKGPKGTGIGLATAKKKVEAHGGEVVFESTPGKGTTFRIFLPIRREPTAAP